MRAAFVILAHERLDRVAALASYLAGQGAAVVVHVDRRVNEQSASALRENLPGAATLITTRRTVWGMFGLVQATLDAVRVLLRDNRAFTHVCLLSGSCLPIRPASDLDALLANAPDADFIESVPIAEASWVKDGLSEERFTLWHPFGWRERRRLFDLSVSVQRALGVRRSLPRGLSPHLGLQWWCLSRATLERIVSLSELGTYEAFFRKVWIPDESFFQTLVRAHGVSRVVNRSLTLQRFDVFGRPHVFHDDHLELLAGADTFFARKIDPDADLLYQHFLDAAPPPKGRTAASLQLFQQAETEVRGEGRGTAGAGRMVRGTSAVKVETNAPYLVLVGRDRSMLNLVRTGLASLPSDLRFHGFLFGPEPSDFAAPGGLYQGCISGDPLLRDYRPAQFLRNLVWADNPCRTVFMFHPEDDPQVAAQLCRDPNARLVFVMADDPKAELNLMRAPQKPRRSKRPRLRHRRAAMPAPLNSWSRVLHQSETTLGPAKLEELATVLRSSWSEPLGWAMPDEGGSA